MILELTNGSIRLSFNTGLDTAAAKLGTRLNDGAWHQITVKVAGFQATLSIDKDTCGAVCSSVTVSTSSDGSSQFSGLPYFGGVSKWVPQIKQQLVTDDSFVGCIKVLISSEALRNNQVEMLLYNLHFLFTMRRVDQRTSFAFVLFQDFLYNNVDAGLQGVFSHSHLVSTGCQRQDVCSNHGCKHGGACVDEWSQYSCRCPQGFVGSSCEHQITATFDSDDNSGLKFTAANITSFSLEFSIDPTLPSGVLAFTGVCLFYRNDNQYHLSH